MSIDASKPTTGLQIYSSNIHAKYHLTKTFAKIEASSIISMAMIRSRRKRFFIMRKIHSTVFFPVDITAACLLVIPQGNRSLFHACRYFDCISILLPTLIIQPMANCVPSCSLWTIRFAGCLNDYPSWQQVTITIAVALIACNEDPQTRERRRYYGCV